MLSGSAVGIARAAGRRNRARVESWNFILSGLVRLICVVGWLVGCLVEIGVVDDEDEKRW